MRLNEDIKSLAARMASRYNTPDSNPFILFLGVGCARAAGVPDIAEIALHAFNDLKERDPSLVTTWLPEKEAVSEEERTQAFYNFLGSLSRRERYRLLQRFYISVPVPLFYQDLAVLTKAGYFSHILTTNIDTLLEQAFNAAGLRQTSDYQVISLGGGLSSNISQQQVSTMPPPSMSDSPIKVIKLHGDLAQQQGILTPDEIEAALEPQGRFLKGEIKGDMVMVGYEFECEPIHRWITKTTGSELWWVNPSHPDSARISPFEVARKVMYIEGTNATPEVFFGQLALMLLRLPVLESMNISFTNYTEIPDPATSTIGSMPGGSLMSDDEIENEYLRSQIRRCQEVLHSLEQAAGAGETNLQLQAQIEYQKRQITDLEDQFRDLSSSRPQVVELMGQIINYAQLASIDPGTMSFLQSQINAVREEFGKTQPNQHIVSASIDATVVVADRLGSKAVKPELVRELASFAPSVTTRGA